jgi:hypothetical protein
MLSQFWTYATSFNIQRIFSDFQYQAAGAVFAVEVEFFFFEDAEGFAEEGAFPHLLGVALRNEGILRLSLRESGVARLFPNKSIKVM